VATTLADVMLWCTDIKELSPPALVALDDASTLTAAKLDGTKRGA
jgi:hypothetical protein